MTQEVLGISPNGGEHDESGSGGGEGEQGAAAEEDQDEELEGAEEERVECEQCEAAPIKVARDPGDPTPEEREQHFITHLPYRSWCPVCVKAKGREESHRKQEGKEEAIKPTMRIDNKSFGQEIESDDKATALVIKDSKTKMHFAHLCDAKGSSDEWVVKKLMEDIDRLGYTEIILKGDGEPALVQVMREVKQRRSHPTIL